MEAMDQWLLASFNVVREALAPGAPDDARKRGAAVCLSLHAMCSPGRIMAFPQMEPEPQARPDVLDALIQRLEMFAPKVAATGFTPPTPTK